MARVVRIIPLTKDIIFHIVERHAVRVGAVLIFAPRDQDPITNRPTLPLRAATLSANIVADVRDALLEARLKAGDFLGTENDLAHRFGVSRIVARDALKALEALGVVDIKVGAGGGARIAQGNPKLFGEALAIQLELIGVTAGEILDAQRAIESLAAELAAENATPEDHGRLRKLLAEASTKLEDMDGFTQSSWEFHLAVAEASHNRVLVIQLISLHHVSWPTHNRTLTPRVASQILKAHADLLALIEARDAGGARRLMNEHVKMIRARRTAERDGDYRLESRCC